MKKRSTKPNVNLLPVAIIYFVLFSFSVWVDSERRIFRFPSVDSTFVQTLVLDLGIGLAAGVLISLFTAGAIRWFKPFQEMTGQFSKILGTIGLKEVFFLSAFSALGEEFFFRGLIQGELGLIWASLIFGLLHIGPNRKFFPWTLFAIAVGFFIGLLYEWRNDLLLVTVTHFSVNFLNLSQLSQRQEKDQGAESS